MFSFSTVQYNAMQCNEKCVGLGKEREGELKILATVSGSLRSCTMIYGEPEYSNPNANRSNALYQMSCSGVAH